MRFGFLSEGDTRPGTTHYHRYHELVEQVLVAERCGFDLFGASEQHLAIGGASTAAPEVLYSYMMALTTRIRFSFAVVLMPFRFNHPIRTAERVATMDIMSNGRMEAIMGRGNTMLALRAFEVSPENNRSQQEEGVDLILQAFLEDPFHFIGEHYKVPPRSLVPKPLQLPHPPFSLAATSPTSHRTAAAKGLGVTSFANFSGFEVLETNLKAYDDAWGSEGLLPGSWRNKGALTMGLICTETEAEARKAFEPLADYVRLAVDAYDRLANLSDDYGYTREIKEHTDRHVDDPEYMINESASFVVGDVDTCIRQVRAFEERGVDDLWLRIDSIPHHQILDTIERFGKYVIPHFKNPGAVVRPPEEVVAAIRAMRPTHEKELQEFVEQADERAKQEPER